MFEHALRLSMRRVSVGAEHGDGRLDSGTEPTRADGGRQRGTSARAAPAAPQLMQPVLVDERTDLRHLHDLMAVR
jgi:hypothetical protein